MAALQTSSKCTAHPPAYFGGLRFFVGLRLALEPNLRLVRLGRGFETTSRNSEKVFGNSLSPGCQPNSRDILLSGFTSDHALYVIFHHRRVILIYYTLEKSNDSAIGLFGFPLCQNRYLYRDRIADKHRFQDL